MIIKRKSVQGEKTIEEIRAEVKQLEKERERVKSHQSDYSDDKAYRLELKYLDEDLEDLRAELGYMMAKENTL